MSQLILDEGNQRSITLDAHRLIGSQLFKQIAQGSQDLEIVFLVMATDVVGFANLSTKLAECRFSALIVEHKPSNALKSCSQHYPVFLTTDLSAPRRGQVWKRDYGFFLEATWTVLNDRPYR